jgi:hypothetical protein
MGRPFTRTLPSRTNCSTPRREPRPAAARKRLIRMSEYRLGWGEMASGDAFRWVAFFLCVGECGALCEDSRSPCNAAVGYAVACRLFGPTSRKHFASVFAHEDTSVSRLFPEGVGAFEAFNSRNVVCNRPRLVGSLRGMASGGTALCASGESTARDRAHRCPVRGTRVGRVSRENRWAVFRERGPELRDPGGCSTDDSGHSEIMASNPAHAQ